MNKKNILLIVIVVVVILLTIGAGTYAYWKWTSNVTKNIAFNTAEGLDSSYVYYNDSDSNFIGNFQPAAKFCQSASTTISFYKTSVAADIDLNATIYMDVNYIGTNMASSNDVYWVLTRGNDSIYCSRGLNASSVISYGTFYGVSDGQKLTLKSNIAVTTEEQKFTVWIWIDSAGTNLSALTGETLDTNVWTEINPGVGEEIIMNTDLINPTLDSGMIPVTIKDDGTVTTISPDDPNWYDYDAKKWANMILVTNASRTNYIVDGEVIPDTPVTTSHIMAYFVWIPRYRYQIWLAAASGSQLDNERSIEIEFESIDDPYMVATAVGDWQTHPAFWWDDDNDSTIDDGELLSGVWMGKFETTGGADARRILPGKEPSNSQSVSVKISSARDFTEAGNPYGTDTTISNAHVAKNVDWGAAAYLAHSVYGIDGEVRTNTYNGYQTGCGSTSTSTAPAASSSCQMKYGSVSVDLNDDDGVTDDAYPQSTTGNVTGMFDMAGGMMEVVMGNYNGKDSSGIISSSDFPQIKYYNKYTITLGDCTIALCGGHALYETRSWYNDDATLVASNLTWMVRGGSYYDTSSSSNNKYVGMFSFARVGGAANYTTWRTAIVIGDGFGWNY